MLLLAEVDFVTQVTVTGITALGAAVVACLPIWLRYRLERDQHEKDLANAKVREQSLQEQLTETQRQFGEVLRIQAELERRLRAVSTPGRSVATGQLAAEIGAEACLFCERRVEVTGDRRCPICGQIFRGTWGGLDAHWRSRPDHEAVMGYEQFWESVCPRHWRWQ